MPYSRFIIFIEALVEWLKQVVPRKKNIWQVLKQKNTVVSKREETRGLPFFFGQIHVNFI